MATMSLQDIRRPKSEGLRASPSPWLNHRAQTAPADRNIDQNRAVLVKDLKETVTMVPLEFFTDGLLPPISREIVDKTLRSLIATGGVVTSRRGSKWPSFKSRPSKRKATEDVVFAQMEDILKDIAEAAGISQTATLKFICRPTATPNSSTRDNPSKPDCYGVLSAENLGDEVDWIDIAIPGEFKKKDSMRSTHDNQKKILWSMYHIMREDPRRRFVYGFTAEDTTMQLWFSSRSETFMSLSFDFLESPRHVIECFLPLLMAEPHQLGWDPTITRVSPRDVTSPNIVYDIAVGENVYRTLRLISNLGAEAPKGRGTRVWEARLLDADKNMVGPPVVVKDSWRDFDRESEYNLSQAIRNSGNLKQQEVLRKYFMEAIDHCDVQIAGQIDHTHFVKRNNSKTEGIQPFRITADLPSGRNTNSLPIVGAYVLPDACPEEGIVYSAKIHNRIVYREVGRTLQEVGSLSQVFNCLADATAALKCLHEVGWVHRDISVGNILEVNGMGKINDVEYAKRADDTSSHSVRTGTSYFMAVEVEERNYRFVQRPNQDSLSRLGQEVDNSEPDIRAARARIKMEKKRQRPEEKTSVGSRINGKHSGTRRVGFRHNSLHDMESLLWVAYWMVLCTKLICPEGISGSLWAKYVSQHAILARKLFCTTAGRSSVLGSNNVIEDALPELAPQVAAIFRELEEFRLQLVDFYQTYERDVARMGPNPAEGLHTKVDLIFDNIIEMLQDPDDDDDDDDYNGEGEPEKIGPLYITVGAVSEQQAAVDAVVKKLRDDADKKLDLAYANGAEDAGVKTAQDGERDSDDEVNGDEDRPAKRQKMLPTITDDDRADADAAATAPI